MSRTRFAIRNMDAGKLLESFMISAVAAVLSIRFFLHITGYPQLGGGKLHIAHMLWGGLLMCAALIIALSFLSKASARAAAVIGGIGFGTFIDEIGKFVTADNDYFYKPTASLIYICFVLLLLAIRSIQRYRPYSYREYLMNALRELEEVVRHDLDKEERNRALYYLKKSDPEDPLPPVLLDLLKKIELVPVPSPSLLTRLRDKARNAYKRAVTSSWFETALNIFFVLQMIYKVIYSLIIVLFHGFGWSAVIGRDILPFLGNRLTALTWTDVGQLIFTFISGIFVLLGVIRMKKSRYRAYKWFEKSIWVSIFFVQGFLFYSHQFAALTGLGFNILLLWAVHFIIEQEESQQRLAHLEL